MHSAFNLLVFFILCSHRLRKWKDYVLSGEIVLRNNNYYYYILCTIQTIVNNVGQKDISFFTTDIFYQIQNV